MIDPNSASNLESFTTRHLDIDWTVEFEKKLVSGHVDLHLERLLPDASCVVLDCSSLAIMSVSVDGKAVDYQCDEEGGKFGGTLSIPIQGNEKDRVVVRVEYETTDGCKALQWLSPIQTAGKKHPFLFSQCQAILARTLLPCQDSPSVKATYSANVRVPSGLTAVMSANERIVNDSGVRFEQSHPIPSYLIALAVGDLASHPVSPISSIWSEPSVLQAASHEFAHLSDFLNVAESICGPYVWGRYDVIVLPPSFPFGGMENPCLTFLTPSLLAGDRSLVNVVAHEIAHSWTGNLVTNRNWEHFWLNEGFTTFLERKIIGKMGGGEAERHLHALVGLSELSSDLESFPAGSEGRKLQPLLHDVDPEDVFSSVPYEKGHTLLFHLETLVGGPAIFEPYLRSYISTFSTSPSLDTSQWLQHLQEYFSKNHPEVCPRLAEIEWDKWMRGDGMPPVIPSYDQSLMTEAVQFAEFWISNPKGKIDDTEDAYLCRFSSWQRMLFLDHLIQHSSNSHINLETLDAKYGLSTTPNVEILLRWLQLSLPLRHTPSYPVAVDFATRHGRMKYCRPIYKLLAQVDRPLAVATFQQHRSFYHPVAAAMIAKDLAL